MKNRTVSTDWWSHLNPYLVFRYLMSSVLGLGMVVTCSSNSLSEALCWQSATTDMKMLSLFKASRVEDLSASWWRIVLVVLKVQTTNFNLQPSCTELFSTGTMICYLDTRSRAVSLSRWDFMEWLLQLGSVTLNQLPSSKPELLGK